MRRTSVVSYVGSIELKHHRHLLRIVLIGTQRKAPTLREREHRFVGTQNGPLQSLKTVPLGGGDQSLQELVPTPLPCHASPTTTGNSALS